MTAPLYDALSALADQAPLRLHMPGHKGRLPGLLRDAAKIDFTELEPTGNLYTGEGPIAQAETLFAEAVGAREALFFSCGATQGILTMLSAGVGLGGTLILDRGCHKSVYHGMALMDITPVYLHPPLLPGTALCAPVSPEEVEAALSRHPEARAVLLTSPSYYGVCTDLEPIAKLCRDRGVFLLVDQAHGAHFPFLGLPSALGLADLTVISTHKTLPALGSSAVLCTGPAAPWDALTLKEQSAVFSTTSPSYPILASIDYARALLEGQAGADYRSAAEGTRLFRRQLALRTPFRPLEPGDGLRLDPCRLTIDTAWGGLSGREADRLLRKENIYAELSDERYLVCILTCQDGAETFRRLLDALCRLPAGPAIPLPSEEPPRPLVRMDLRSAQFGPSRLCPLRDAAGEISAQIIAPYPPGVPVVAPGEEITEKHIAYLQKKSYNIDEPIRVCHSS